ncbi:MAG: molybdate ABC transporter substrate-binding protein [Peptococcaceae bacterium]|jgi:molybdate transport system substrate-binding protein|nr:molybdate ABC transporter substrate-binding protein [Peptococcaceae bacterium]
MYTKKRVLAFLLAVCLFIAMIPTVVLAANETVVVSSQKLTVNGEAVDVFASYNINNENYLKIRDIAYLLQDTPARFSVGYANGAVTIKTNTAYASTREAGPIKPVAYKSFDGVSNDQVTIDGSAVPFTVYKIDGANYFRLRDFAAIGAVTSYDAATNTARLTTAPTEPVTLLVHAAASLKTTFESVIADFSAKYPNIKVELNTGGSGALVTQIQEGAGGDLFFSADQANMDKLAADIVTDTRADLLKNSLVLIVPSGNPKGITSFEDALDKAGSDVVAIGEAKTVPAGDRAREVYTSLGLLEKLEALTLTLDDSVTKVLNHVASGDAVAGFVYSTDAASESKVTVIAAAPADSHAPIIYPGAVLKESKNQDAAKVFLAYLSSESARERFTAAGFVIAE